MRRQVPRFYFTLRTDRSVVPDPEGSELVDLDAARDEAISSARCFMSAEMLHGRDVSDWSIEITDASHHIIAAVPFHEAIQKRRSL